MRSSALSYHEGGRRSNSLYNIESDSKRLGVTSYKHVDSVAHFEETGEIDYDSEIDAYDELVDGDGPVSSERRSPCFGGLV